MLSEEEKRKHHYQANRKWRMKNPEMRHASTRRYYARTRKFSELGRRKRWTDDEIEMVMKHEIPDRELAQKLHRSVQAIQVQRSRIKKEAEN